MKTSELSGPALDWAVAKCEGIEVVAVKSGRATFLDPADDGARNEMPINYSTDWAQGGPIIEREGIGLDFYEDGGHEYGGEWGAATNEGTVHALGRTPLIAAMRCYVASKLGDDVDVPNELKEV